MTQQAFERMTEELLVAIEALLKGELRVPGLLLLYGGMDIMASLNRPTEHADVVRSDFIEWTERYLLCGRRLACTPQDLYAARCGLLHSCTGESRASRQDEAKQIWYAWGTGRVEDLERFIEDADRSLSVAVHVDHLFHSFQRGVKLFKRALYDDPEKANLVYERADKFLANMPTLTRRHGSA
jgi:hypothetical protein